MAPSSAVVAHVVLVAVARLAAPPRMVRGIRANRASADVEVEAGCRRADRRTSTRLRSSSRQTLPARPGVALVLG